MAVSSWELAISSKELEVRSYELAVRRGAEGGSDTFITGLRSEPPPRYMRPG